MVLWIHGTKQPTRVNTEGIPSYFGKHRLLNDATPINLYSDLTRHANGPPESPYNINYKNNHLHV